MPSKLFATLSSVALLGLSTVAYSGWTKYVLGEGETPKGDCLEMLCPHGCLEDDTGNANCCSAGNLGDKCWEGLCCQDGLFCSSTTGEGKCIECTKDEDCAGELVCNPDNTCGGCPTGTTLYTKPDGTQDCCNTINNILVTITGSKNQACCPKTKPKWDGNKCVECLPDEKCEASCIGTKLFTKGKKDGQDKFQCCTNEHKVITGTANVLFKGYLENTNTQKGCCPTDRTYENTCCKDGTKALSTGCCDESKVYTENGQQKCCTTTIYTEDGEDKCCTTNSNLPKHGESCNTTCGCFNKNTTGLTCSSETNKCICSENYSWDETNKKCLSYCADKEKFGVIFMIDRSGSTKNVISKGDKRYYEAIDSALAGVNLYENVYSAVFQEDANETLRTRLSWNKNSVKDIRNVFENYKFVESTSGTYFLKTLNDIHSICKKGGDVKIAVLWFTDGVFPSVPKHVSAIKDVRDNCSNVSITFIAPEKSKNSYDVNKFCDIKGNIQPCLNYFSEKVDENICIPK